MIKAHLTRTGRLAAAASFGDAYHTLSQKDIVKNKWAVLLFLYDVMQDEASSTKAYMGPAVDSILGVKAAGLPVAHRPVRTAGCT